MEDHDHSHEVTFSQRWKLLLAIAILVVMLTMEFGFGFVPGFPIDLAIYLAAYLLAGHDVLYMAWRKAQRLDFFNEFFLMSVATIGAFAIGSYSEGVAVMAFYSVGEWFQDAAVDRAKRSIRALLDIRPDEVLVMRDGQFVTDDPKNVNIGDTIRTKPGEKVALDGKLLSNKASFNTAALTGESIPEEKSKGEIVLAGMINLNTPAEIRVSALFRDSKLSKILEMVQDATARKSQTQLFISRFAKIYTPIVFALAILVVIVPYFIVDVYEFRTWFYRALVFLVISCPCALVVSIPLGYFGGIGLASRNGILVKGSNFLDVMTQVDTIVMDKTGTMTTGEFKVTDIAPESPMTADDLLGVAAALESHSTHPIAEAVVNHAREKNIAFPEATNLTEIPGHGLSATVGQKRVLLGNAALMQKDNVAFPQHFASSPLTLVMIAIDSQFAGAITIADTIRPDAARTVSALHAMGIKTAMLSGDKPAVVELVARELGIDDAHGGLLPEDKVAWVQKLKDEGRRMAVIGDGVNDAPMVALADAGIAMGGLGSDATVETADIVIQNDHPSKIVSAIKIGKLTRKVVWQNITMAMVVKIAVLALGAGGIATLWEAVIADVGVALLAILNAVRIQRIKIDNS